MKKVYYLSEDQIKKGIKLCVKKIKYVLCSVKILCNNNGNESIAVSLHTIAIEEFGKVLLLQKI